MELSFCRLHSSLPQAEDYKRERKNCKTCVPSDKTKCWATRWDMPSAVVDSLWIHIECKKYISVDCNWRIWPGWCTHWWCLSLHVFQMFIPLWSLINSFPHVPRRSLSVIPKQRALAGWYVPVWCYSYTFWSIIRYNRRARREGECSVVRKFAILGFDIKFYIKHVVLVP